MQIKKIFQLGLTLSILCTATISLAALWGDINRDEKIGLAEAIYALQVSSGLKPQYVNETHTGTLTSNETWTPNGNPHIISGTLTIAGDPPNGATLTIQPGVEVWFEENASIEIGKDNSPGTLQALGSETSGIVFTSNQSSKTKGWWDYIRFNEQAVNCRMSYCNIEYGGGYDNWNTAGNVVIYKAENVIVKNCTITKSGTNGVFFVDNTGFVTFSDNTITGNGDNENKNYGRYGISLYADQVRGIDVTNQVAGNELGGVYIRKDTVTNTATWYNLDAPYIVGDVTVADTNGVTLTLKAGTQFRFIEGSMFEVGAADKPGTLVADGTAGDILFTGHQTVKTKGWWNGIRFNSTAVNCILKNCKVEYGGGYASWNSAANVVVITQNGTDIYDSDISNSENYGMKFLSGGTANIEDTAFSTNNLEDIYIYDNNSGYTGSPAGSPSIKGP